jgi:hypothetical protein
MQFPLHSALSQHLTVIAWRSDALALLLIFIFIPAGKFFAALNKVIFLVGR